MGWLRKENIDHEKHQSARIENWKQYALKVENVQQMGQNRSQCLWQNCKKLGEWNGIYIEKSQIKTSEEEKMTFK